LTFSFYRFILSVRAFHNDGYRHAKNFIVEKLDLSGKEIGVSILNFTFVTVDSDSGHADKHQT
jgi:hypothetical protein